ncbi:MAG: hypothetical protein NVS2B16_10740 [Chloroflexota bacterium]
MPALDQLIRDATIGLLRHQSGAMARLGSENGVCKLDWVEGVERLLAHDAWLESVEREASDLVDAGIRHIIWSGMGGSVMSVRVLVDMNFFAGTAPDSVTIYPLDSTDPAALNAIVRRLAEAKGVDMADADTATLAVLLDDVMMIGVSMGQTSEEPITHLEWFLDLLDRCGLQAPEHVVVMTIPDSYLDTFARERDISRRSLQLDGGTGTGGRMSAPATRVFLLPAALALLGAGIRGPALREVLARAWRGYDLDKAEIQPGNHPFVRLAAALVDMSSNGACQVLLDLPPRWRPVLPWIEQLMEESLGKGGKGVVVFESQTLADHAPCRRVAGIVEVSIRAIDSAREPFEETRHASFDLQAPCDLTGDVVNRLAGVATFFLGWQLAMALYGYLHDITFAGQPAVEEYKARARLARAGPDPLQSLLEQIDTSVHGPVVLLPPTHLGHWTDVPAALFAGCLRRALQDGRECPPYLDLTLNGDYAAEVRAGLHHQMRHLGNDILGVPVKLRLAPAAYHSTEQSEMDGPPGLVSLRVVARQYERVFVGTYSDAFLKAQAVSTWQAMIDQGRTCFLLVVNGPVEHVGEHVMRFFEDVESVLR